MNDNQRLIIILVGVLGLSALWGTIGLLFLQRTVADVLPQIVLSVLTFFGGMGVEKSRQRTTDRVIIDQPPNEPVPVEVDKGGKI